MTKFEKGDRVISTHYFFYNKTGTIIREGANLCYWVKFDEDSSDKPYLIHYECLVLVNPIMNVKSWLKQKRGILGKVFWE